MFFRQLKVRKGRNSILYLFNENGVKIDDHGEMNDLIINFYKDLLAQEIIMDSRFTCPSGPSVGEDFFDEILKMPSKEDVKHMVWSIGIQKFGGPDGFGSDFKRKGWRIVGNYVYRVVREFFGNGILLKQSNHTFISLVPKGDNQPYIHLVVA